METKKREKGRKKEGIRKKKGGKKEEKRRKKMGENSEIFRRVGNRDGLAPVKLPSPPPACWTTKIWRKDPFQT